VTERADGNYSVAYISSRGFTARGLVKREHVRLSKDPKGRPVGCALPPSHEDRWAAGGEQGNLHCLYFNPTM